MSMLEAKRLAREAGLIPHEDVELDELEHEMRYDLEWFLTEGLLDPRKRKEDCRHPLMVDMKGAMAAEVAKLQEFTLKQQRLHAGATKLKRFWQDYEIILNPFANTVTIADREKRVGYWAGRGSMRFWVQEADLNAPGYFRWEWNGEACSSISFQNNPIRTKRQIAGFVGGQVGRKDLSIIQTGWVKGKTPQGKVRLTPYYTVYISEPVPQSFLAAENSYAKSLKMLDVDHLEKISRKLRKTEERLNQAQAKHKELREESLNDREVERWGKHAKRMMKNLNERRQRYSEAVAKAHENADFDKEPLITLLCEGPDQELIEVDTSRDREEEEDRDQFADSLIIEASLRDQGDFTANQAVEIDIPLP